MSQPKVDSYEIKKIEWNHKYKKYQVSYCNNVGAEKTAFVNPMKVTLLLNGLSNLRVFRNKYKNIEGATCEYWDLM